MNFKGKKEVVKAVQKLLGVSADGADGPVTWNAILAKLSTKEPVISGSTLPEKMVSLARREIGVSEVDGSNCGPRVDEYKAATCLAGDIVVFSFSHIGLAVADVDSSGYVKTIEGNTNGAGSREGGSVLEKNRHVSKIRSRIRIL